MTENKEKEEGGVLRPEINTLNKVVNSGSGDDFFRRNLSAIRGAFDILKNPDEVRELDW